MSLTISKEDRIKSIHNNFMLLMRASKRWFGEHLQTFGLTFPQFISLAALAAHKEPCTMSDVTNVTFQDPPTTTGVIDRLVKMKLVQRTRSQTDRRVVLVQATKTGVDLIEEIEGRLMTEATPTYALLTDEELGTFEYLLRRLLRVQLQNFMSIPDSAIDAELEKLEHFVNDPIAYSKLENK